MMVNWSVNTKDYPSVRLQKSSPFRFFRVARFTQQARPLPAPVLVSVCLSVCPCVCVPISPVSAQELSVGEGARRAGTAPVHDRWPETGQRIQVEDPRSNPHWFHAVMLGRVAGVRREAGLRDSFHSQAKGSDWEALELHHSHDIRP